MDRRKPEPRGEPAVRRFGLRAAVGVVRAVGLVIAFSCAVVAGALVHLDVPASRRLVIERANAILAQTFAGDVRIDGLERLTPRSAAGMRVRVSDPEGVPVLRLDGVSFRVRLPALIRSLAELRGPIAIDVDSLSIEEVEASAEEDAHGRPRVKRALEARLPPESAALGRGAGVDVTDLAVSRARVRDALPSGDVELSALAGSGRLDTASRAMSVDVERARVTARGAPRGLDARGVLRGHFASAPEGAADGDLDVDARFEGYVGGAPVVGSVRLRGDDLEARVDARDPAGDSARAAMSELAIREDVTLAAEARGRLPHLDVRATLTTGRTRLDVTTSVDRGARTRIAGSVVARAVDLAAIVGGAPASDLGFDGRWTVAIRDGAPWGEARISVRPGTVDGAPSPPVELTGRFAGPRVEVSALVHDPILPARVVVDVRPRSDGRAGRSVEASVHASAPDLSRVPVAGANASGSATIVASARVALPERAFDADLEVTGSRLAIERGGGRATVGAVRLRAGAKGTPERAEIALDVDADDVASSGRALSRACAGATIDVAGPVVTLREPRVDVLHERRQVSASARLVRVVGARLRVEGAELTGLGEPIRGELERGPRGVRASIEAPRIDLGRLARIAGYESDLANGSLGLRGAAAIDGQRVDADVHADLAGLRAGEVEGATARLDASLHGQDVSVDLRADLGGAGRVELRSEDLVVGGRPTDAVAWARARGHVRVDAELDLARAASLLPRRVLPLADVRGTLTLRGRVGRDAPDVPPELGLSAYTRGLLVAARAEPGHRVDGLRIEAPARWRSSDVDLGLDVRTDGRSGLSNVAFRATDRHGALLALDAKALVPFAELARDPGRFADELGAAPISSRLVVPRRRLDQLPTMLGVHGFTGAVALDLEAEGTLRDPRVRVEALGEGLGGPALPPGLVADSAVTMGYRDGVTDVAIKIRSVGRELLDVTSRVEADLREVALGRAPVAWTADGHARLSSLPLEVVPDLADRQVKGLVSGELRLSGLHRDARLAGRLDVDGFTVGKTRYDAGTISLHAGAGWLTSEARLSRPDGFLDVSASSGLRWGGELAPALDPDQPLEVRIVANALRAAVFQPLVESFLPTLDGRIDAHARVRLAPGQPPTLEGEATLRDGAMHVAALGEELRSVRARVRLSPDGKVVVDDVFARGAQGEISADANVVLYGTRLSEATANVRVPRRRALDLAPGGQAIGQVSGEMTVHAKRSPDDDVIALSVDVPRGRVELPRVTKTGLQRLEKRENIRVGVYRDRRTFVTLPLDRADIRPGPDRPSAPPTEITVRLGSLEVVRQNQAQVVLTGSPRLRVEDDETTVTGQLDLTRGWVIVQGRKFEIERGTVTWSDAPADDPTVVATAGWTAPDGTRVFADFIGPAATGRVTLRSEPAMPKSEILALVLFGTASGANPTPAPPGRQPDGTTRAAVGIGGGIAAQGLAGALDDLTGLQATARIDTTRGNNLRPELEIQISPRVSISFAHVIGTPPITEPDRNFATIEYRFYKHWSLETTAGDRGRAMVDAIWQRRY